MKRTSYLAAAAGVISLMGLAAGTSPASAAEHGSAQDVFAANFNRPGSFHINGVPQAAAAGNYIGNASDIGIGVMHIQDGVYTQGSYDVILPVNAWTDQAFGWANAAGWYNGPGMCSEQLRSDDGGSTWYRQTPDLGPGQHFIGLGTDYDVYQYSC